MAITKILARKGRLDVGISYVLNGDKTQERVLTAHLNCDPGRECRQMLDTKRAYGKEDGVMYYHIIQSFKPGEVTPEQALEIATEFAKEHLPGYETVIGVHVDREHIHAHLVFNSVNADTGEKYHSNAQSYYQQIRATSDRLCREHGLSVIMEGSPGKAVSYIEWLRQSRGQPTFRSMLEADLRTTIQDANDLGHFFMLMEHKGWEISHGNLLGFRLRGQDRFMYPGRKNLLFTEEGIRAAIQSGLEDIEAGRRPAMIYRAPYRPYKKHPKYTGIMALYVHYLYVLGKIGQQHYPPRMTPQLRQEVMKADRYREQFDFLRENGIATQGDAAALQARTEETLASLERDQKGRQDTGQEVEIYFNFVGKYIPPTLKEAEPTPEELEELRKKNERRERAHRAYLQRKASGAQKRYEDKIKARKKAEMDAKKDAIRAEDMAKGIYTPVGKLSRKEPQRAAQASAAI